LEDLKIFVGLCDAHAPVYLKEVTVPVMYTEDGEEGELLLYELHPLKLPTPIIPDGSKVLSFVIEDFHSVEAAEEFCVYYGLAFMGHNAEVQQ
jgi:hypothetical protein